MFLENAPYSHAVIKYHHICRNDKNRICFYDFNYFCLCQPDSKRVNCFGHNTLIDICNLCLSGGKCIKGDLKNPKDFTCLCRPCHQGRLCEINLKSFGFTIDSLLTLETTWIQSIYVGLVFVLFSMGLFTNFCSLVTFKRSQPRTFGVGNYLLTVTIANQCSLLFLWLKFIHIMLGSVGLISDVSCKVGSYLLSALARSTYWLNSWIAIDRFLIVLFPTLTLVRNPRISIYSSIGTLLLIFLMHVHEIIVYQTIDDPDSSAVLCISNYVDNVMIIYNRVTTLIHHLLPFCIQMISISLIIMLAARSRARTIKGKATFGEELKKQFSRQKELYVIPTIIILSALPHTILSFSLACTQLNGWKRHTLLLALLSTYVPQMLGFILYVLPSSTYKQEFSKTSIGQKCSKWIFKTTPKKVVEPQK